MARHLAPATPRRIDTCFVTVYSSRKKKACLPFFPLGLATCLPRLPVASSLCLSCFAPFRLVMKAGKRVSSLRLHMVEMVSSHFGAAAVGRAGVGRSESLTTSGLPAVVRILYQGRHVISYQSFFAFCQASSLATQ